MIIIDDEGESTYTIIIKGDINGDGIIGTADYLLYRRSLLDTYKMNNIEEKPLKLMRKRTVNSGIFIFKKYLHTNGKY